MSVADELAKLQGLRIQGVITDAEFELQKRTLIGGEQSSTAQSPPAIGDSPSWDRIPIHKKWWFQALAALLFYPAGLLLIIFVPSYRKKGGKVVPAERWFRVLFAVLIALVVMFNLAKFASAASPNEAGTFPNLLSERSSSDKFVETVAGSLLINKPLPSENKYEILLNNRKIFESDAYEGIYIDRVLSGHPKAERVLVHFNNGGNACPAVYRIIDLTPRTWIDRVKGFFKNVSPISEKFGSCDDQPVARSNDKEIAVDFRSQSGIERWIYTLSNRSLVEKQLSWDAYKPLKLAAIQSAAQRSMHNKFSEIEEITDNFPGTPRDRYADKLVYVENAAGTISGWIKLSDVIALMLTNQAIEKVGAIQLNRNPAFKGIGIVMKPGGDYEELGFFFEPKGEKLYYKYLAANEGVVPVLTPADNAQVGSLMWNMIGAEFM